MSTVIKAGRAGPILRQLRTVDLVDHLAEARAVIEQAQREAARIVAAARREETEALEAARRRGAEQGYREGYERGQTEGRQAARAEALTRFERREEQVVAALQDATAQIEACKADLRINAERDLLEFATQVARKVTFAVGRTYPEAVQENLRRALELVAAQTDLIVRVHPDDLESLKLFAPKMLKESAQWEAVKIVADDTIAPGGCVVDSRATVVDATLETQVDTLVALLLGTEVHDG